MLFSEPKIPQSRSAGAPATPGNPFQCSSASRKFLNFIDRHRDRIEVTFQCSSASRKFLNSPGCASRMSRTVVSVLFSEPKIPQLTSCPICVTIFYEFQCSSASRKFLNRAGQVRWGISSPGFSALQRAENSSISTLAPASIHISDRDDHASSFLSLPGASP